MKYIKFYKNQNIKNNKVFDNFINTTRDSIKVWDYFINWKKVKSNTDNIKIELNLLNSLIGTKNFEKDFINLILKYPNIIKTLPILLAVRENELKIIKDYKKLDLSYIHFNFKIVKITRKNAGNYLLFVKNSGLSELFFDRRIKNFVDYVFGVEAGLDSNGRKNRGGNLMEEIVKVFIKKEIIKNRNLEYLHKATPSKIKVKWGVNIEFEKSERTFDFAVFNKKTEKLFLIETNFYNGGGSKLKSVCGEFKSLFNELQKQNIELIWITDGKGWLSARKPLEETFNHNNYIFNLNQLSKNVLSEIFIY